MSLIVDTRTVRDLSLGTRSGFEDGRLEIDAERLARELEALDDAIERVRVRAALPGESTRIYCCKDVIQPTVKVSGEEPGSGRRAVLENLAVVTCGPIVGFQEGIIDMSGPGARLSPVTRRTPPPGPRVDADRARAAPRSGRELDHNHID